MRRKFRNHPVVFLLIGTVIFLFAQFSLLSRDRLRVGAELEVRLPLFVQVVMVGGDRYLAASWAAVRALVAETVHMKPQDYEVLGLVQADVSWLNPAHEDNYYTAAAILPWEGQLSPALTVLKRATQARPYDYAPPFFYAFYLLQFQNDAIGAAEWLRRSALRLPDPEERLIMENYAARWLDRSQDLDVAAAIVDAMAAQAKRKDFADYLRQRAQRLRNLAMLRHAAREYAGKFGRPPDTLEALVKAGFIGKVPADPLNIGFAIDRDGVPVFANSEKK